MFVKTTLLEIGKKPVFPQFFENLSNGIDGSLAWVFGVDEDIIKIIMTKILSFLAKILLI